MTSPHPPADWIRGGVVYQIYPRSFMDSSGDGAGDLKGITARLPHAASLGADAIWISPFFRSPMRDFGYDVSDYRAVDPRFGDMADFDALLAAAHSLGLKVVVDMVISHCSDRHPWFAESRSSRDNPKADWFVWADARPDGTPPNNWLSVFGGPAWEWDSTRRQYYLHNFLDAQPDFNFHNPRVRAALLAECEFWLERGVDGFRLDTVNFYYHDAQLRNNPPAERAGAANLPSVNPYGMQRHLHSKTRPENPEFIARELRPLADRYGAGLLGEIGAESDSLETLAEYTRPGRLQLAYGFDFLGGALTAAHFRECIAEFERRAGESWPCWAFSNHDVARHVSRWGAAGRDPAALAKLCCCLLLSLRGSACIYQGEELGLTEAEIAFEDLQDPYGIRFWPKFKGRDGCRTPMPWESGKALGGFTAAPRAWLPMPPEHVRAAVDAQEKSADSVLRHYRRVLKWRKGVPPLVLGTMELLDAPEDVLALAREWEGERVVAVFNLSDRPARFAGAFSPLPDAPRRAEFSGRAVALPPLGFAFCREKG